MQKDLSINANVFILTALKFWFTFFLALINFFPFQLLTWNPTIQNPYCGQVIWTVPENVEIQVTLFRDSRHAEYEDKDWTFVIEDVRFYYFCQICFGQRMYDYISFQVIFVIKMSDFISLF